MAADPQGFTKTLRHGVAGGEEQWSATGVTLVGLSTQEPVRVDAEEEAASAAPAAAQMNATQSGTVRTTVLPRRRAQPTAANVVERARFEHVRVLGEGGMGMVELARDNDIRRTVAVKRLKGDVRSAEALLRFADEVRIVGQLEHPAIVPIYDVGRDEGGEVYLVMKHLNGETMEVIIERLQARDPAYVARFPVAQRVHIFLAVLDAMRYAHARGILHRDLKPANIMVGPYGEVTVLDWGIAKPIKPPSSSEPGALPLDSTLLQSQDQRLQDSQLGALAGTPLYMSPEQAAGHNDDLDERSDVYTLCVVLFEWLALDHPRKSKRTLFDLLGSIVHEDFPKAALDSALRSGVLPQYLNLLTKGLVRDRDKRLSSVAELEQRLEAILDGRMPIECHVTLAKRVAHEGMRWIDRHPFAYTLLFFGSAAALAWWALWAGYTRLRG